MWQGPGRRRRSRLVIATFFIFFLLFFYSAPLRTLLFGPPCPYPHMTKNVVVAVKTGATEAKEKVAVQMQTTLRCAKHVVHFSDLEQKLGRYRLHDALADVSKAVREHVDFDFYREQQALWNETHDVSSLKDKKHSVAKQELASWVLDKYKNLHILEMTYKMKPGFDWYMIIDADTYVNWANLMHWLGAMDHEKRWWWGGTQWANGLAFAHGGSGVIMSKKVVKNYASAHRGTAHRLDPNVHNSCCGDLVLSNALREYGNKLTNARPSMNGNKPVDVPYLNEYWCQPVITWHHIQPVDMKVINEYELLRPNKTIPMTYGEYFINHMFHSIQAMGDSPHDDWDNMANKLEYGSGHAEGEDRGKAADSVEACADRCRDDSACFQYSYDGATCFIGKSIRLGSAKTPAGERVWKSGWMQERIARWADKQPGCPHVQFPYDDNPW